MHACSGAGGRRIRSLGSSLRPQGVLGQPGIHKLVSKKTTATKSSHKTGTSHFIVVNAEAKFDCFT